jgi:ATP phosphoribosyltransferase regulatory subunit
VTVTPRRAARTPVTPQGTGDLLPPEAQARRALARRVLGTFELAGYELVVPPTFEHADVVARGNEIDSRDLLRFVEPESGEVAVMRPDITPQIARIVATQMHDLPGPYRLCYEGRITRRRRGRARRHQQISQAGVECIGVPGVEGDAEIVTLAIEALHAAGLAQFRVELSEVSLVRSLVQTLEERDREAVLGALAQKDQAGLRALAASLHIARRTLDRLERLMDGYGDLSVLRAAARSLTGDEAQRAVRSLEALSARLEALGLGQSLSVDLGEVRGLGYYTGISFNILADGPGEAIGGGGRYDGLLERFGRGAPATGFAIDLGNLQWTLARHGVEPTEPRPVRVLVCGGDEARRRELARQLRGVGLVAATLCTGAARDWLAFARAWRYDATLALETRGVRASRVSDGATRAVGRFDSPTLDALRTWAQHSED